MRLDGIKNRTISKLFLFIEIDLSFNVLKLEYTLQTIIQSSRMDQLPMEILLKIFSYVSDHKTVALVNRRFYDAVRTLDAPLIILGVFEKMVSISFPFVFLCCLCWDYKN